jgi:5-methylcytosine-specific restriction endonuclease McrA
LREIEARKLYIPAGYSSLFDFAVKVLGYSEGAADRRIKAMRLLSALPHAESLKIEASLSAGELSLSNLSTLQRFFITEKKDRQRSYSVPERVALIEELKHKSAREAERVLVTHSPESARTKLHFTADDALTKKLERLKELLSHQLPCQDMNALLHKLADMALKTLEPAPTPQSTPTSESAQSTRSKNPRYIPAKIKAVLLQKAQNQCQYTDRSSGQRCTTRHYLQIDHITPVAQGGDAKPQNLRVLCAIHNKYSAQQLGLPAPLFHEH